MRRRRGKPRIADIVREIATDESCGPVEALMVFGLRAVLAGMSRVPYCYDHIVLKGGTALHLALGEPIGRISTDLDLSLFEATRDTFDPTLITDDVARETATVLADLLENPAHITIKTPEDRSHPRHPELPALYQYRVVVEARLGSAIKPTIAEGKRFAIELAIDELVDAQTLEDLVVEPHGLPIRLRMYAPVQAIAEKLRAILQKHQHFDRTRNAGSFHPRHVLDLVLLARRLQPGYEPTLRSLFHQKCERRLVPPAERTVDRLTNPMLREAVASSASPHRDEAWALLEQLADEVCPEGVP